MCSKYNNYSNMEESITLVSFEGDKFNISKKAASLSGLFLQMMNLNPNNQIDDSGSGSEEEDNEIGEINLNKYSTTYIQDTVKFLEYYVHTPMPKIEAPLPIKAEWLEALKHQFYRDYVNQPKEYIIKMIEIANYLDIQPILNLMCASFASIIKGKTPEEIKEIFNLDDEEVISNDDDSNGSPPNKINRV